ncbi:proline dehydrogenase family protein [Flexithrix dorotheae]|uniref:proline dehydrogenase family protein n=1 Tax=Flexithrix dorotheae TaxID=70993 RepID=UPI0004779927|nr:proline dehydrogenase family protein [Flexithrix dorotheae]
MTENLHINFTDTRIAFASKNSNSLRKAYFLFSLMNWNGLVKLGTFFIQLALKLNLPVKPFIRRTLFSQFCGGENIEDCNKTIRLLSEYNIGTILDYAVEGASNEKHFLKTFNETLANVQKSAGLKEIPFCVFKITGLASHALLAKIQSKKPLSPKEEEQFEKLRVRVDTICQTAFEHKVRLFIDAEETWIQVPIDNLVREMMEKYNKNSPIVYNTYQLYCVNKLLDLKNDYKLAKERGYFLGAKLVRGAYMEKERERAERLGYPDPIQPNKTACDLDYNTALEFCVKHIDTIAICAGTHNENSCYHLTALLRKHDIPNGHSHIHFAQLYGMSDNISFNLSKAGYNVAKYVPYGPIKAVLPYLFRRAEENTSIAGQTSREFNLIKSELKRRKSEKAVKAHQ